MKNSELTETLDKDFIRRNSYFSKNGYVIKKSILTKEEIDYLKRELWGNPLQDQRFSMFNSTINSRFPLFIETKNKIYIPKMFGIKRYGVANSSLSNYEGSSWNKKIEFTGELYDYQKEPVDILLNELQNGNTGGILSLATGGGKSISALYVLQKLKGKTIIIVNKVSLLRQWEMEIAKFLPEASVGILQGQKKIPEDINDKDIIIAMLQSLAKIDYPSHFFENIRITLVDEVHNLSSKVFSKVLMKMSSMYTIGLSATPQRSDGCEYVFQWFIGDVVFRSKSERRGLAPIINTIQIESDEYREVSNVNKITGQNQIQFSTMLNELVIMPKRNRLIVELVKNCVDKEKRRILILSDRRHHVKTIKNLLDKDMSVNFTYGLFLGQMKIEELERSKASQVILATYQAFGEGVSERDLDTLILATPKKFIGHLKTTKNESGKLEQIVGRIFRKEHTDKNPLIIDLQDNFSIYKNHSRQRVAFYKQHFPVSNFRKQSINLDDYEIKSISMSCLVNVSRKKTINEEPEEELSKQLYQQCLLD